jgi:hypothetical protein
MYKHAFHRLDNLYIKISGSVKEDILAEHARKRGKEKGSVYPIMKEGCELIAECLIAASYGWGIGLV